MGKVCCRGGLIYGISDRKDGGFGKKASRPSSTDFHFVNYLVSGPKDLEDDDVISIRNQG